MPVNSFLTRHCCPIGTYWDPSIQECQDFTECYDPDPALKPCQHDFNNDLMSWAADVEGANNVNYNPQDCVVDSFIDMGITTEVLCCPVYEAGKSMYLYVDITYYIQE